MRNDQSVDLDSSRVVPLQTMADALKKELSDELTKLQSSIPALVNRVSELETLIINTYSQIKELEDKAKSTERKGGFIDATVNLAPPNCLKNSQTYDLTIFQRATHPHAFSPSAPPMASKPNSPRSPP